jgi:hypothetical protein
VRTQMSMTNEHFVYGCTPVFRLLTVYIWSQVRRRMRFPSVHPRRLLNSHLGSRVTVPFLILAGRSKKGTVYGHKGMDNLFFKSTLKSSIELFYRISRKI